MDIETIKKSIRIITIAKKPDDDEFWKIAKITGAGIVAVGLAGAIVSFAFRFI
ncbi:MAG: protein translocase SEC61 complex subunit gamma [Candidatus Micrarchaeia archaeon]